LFFVLVLLLVTAVTHTSAQAGRAAAGWQAKVDGWVRETAVEQTETEFLVLLREQADLSGADALPTKEAKGAFVYAQLTAVAQQSQKPLLTELRQMGLPHRAYWIANMVWVRGDATAVQAIAQREDVARIVGNPTVALDVLDGPTPLLPTAPTGVGWNIELVQATAVWQMGITGQGVIIGGQDTGYNWTHPGLINQYRGWDGLSASHDYNWHYSIPTGDPTCAATPNVPCDDFGTVSHGTHTMGTMVGNDLAADDPAWPAGATNAVGMAPGAEWIGCRNMNQGNGTPASYAGCYEWFVAPYPLGGDPMTEGNPALAPHVINNSWGCPPSEGCTTPDVLLEAVQAVRAAGIVTVHSAGNNGPSCGTVSDPAATYAESFTVGNTKSSVVISVISSRGPSVFGGLLKPNVTAPGSSIRSTIGTNGYGNLTGTSMAAPHVAGLVALIIAANPALAGQVAEIEQIMMDTAVPLTTDNGCGDDGPDSVPNHTYGYGRINALAAVQMARDSFVTLFLPVTLNQ
jgi:subtilisin family serine protease